MYLERRLNSDDLYLVENEKQSQKGYCWQRAAFTDEYGDGALDFVFEAAGRHPHPYCLDLVHANNVDEAEALIQKKHGTALKLRHLIRMKKRPVLIHR